MSTYFYKALVLISSFYYGISAIPEYCLHPLNKDDCNGKPTRVFSYYRPGSRCEIQVWRGCPTLNLFVDEISCSDLCIGVIYQPPEQSEETEDEFDGENSRIHMLSVLNDDFDSPCYQRFNGDDCGGEAEMKYFFEGDLCVRTEWRGCESPNLFDDLESCIKLCHPTSYFDPQIKEKIAKLSVADVKLIDSLIEDAIDQETIINELPVLSNYQKRLPQKKIMKLLLKNYNFKNFTSVELEKSDEKNELVSDPEENEDVEDIEEPLDEKHKEEPTPELLTDYEEEEGSLEEVFTLA